MLEIIIQKQHGKGLGKSVPRSTGRWEELSGKVTCLMVRGQGSAVSYTFRTEYVGNESFTGSQLALGWTESATWLFAKQHQTVETERVWAWNT